MNDYKNVPGLLFKLFHVINVYYLFPTQTLKRTGKDAPNIKSELII